MDTIVTPVTVITLDSTRIVHSIKADLVARYFPPVVRLVQYDMSLPVIAVSLMQNGQTYTLPSGAAANIRVHKPDSTYVYNPALGCDSTRNIVYFEVTQAMAAASGDGLAIVEIVVDGDIAGTSLITLHFEENPVPEDAIESSDEWETIYELGERIIASTVTPVSTAAGMTDHNVVYLYTGTESGWNQGHMYYYNGTTWVDAGIAVTDKTLTVEGLAADAKKTGEEIADLKDGLTAVESDVTDLKEDLSYINTAIDVGYNVYDTSLLSGNNTAVTSNGDGTYTVGTSDWGRSWFGGAVLVKAGAYLLYGVPQGVSYLSTNQQYDDAMFTNDTAEPKKIVLESDATLYLCFRIDPEPSESFVIRPFLMSTIMDENAKDIKQVSADLFKYNSMNIMDTSNSVSRTKNGVTFTWSVDKTQCSVSGTATDIATSLIYDKSNMLPYAMEAGKTYIVVFNSDYVTFRLFWYDSNGSYARNIGFTHNGIFTIPSDAVGAYIRLEVAKGLTVNETVDAPVVLNSYSNAMINDLMIKNSKSVSENQYASCDDITESSILFVSSVSGNLYIPDFVYVGWLQTIPVNSDIVLQIAYPYNSNDVIKMRVKTIANGWTPWRAVAGGTTTITQEVSKDTYQNTYNITTSPQITTDSNGWLQPVDTNTADETNKTDMTGAIMSMLTDTGYCHLAPGIYYVSGNIDMPADSMLEGCGKQTIIRLLQSTTSGYIVRMHTRSTVKNVCFSGSYSTGSISDGNIGGRRGINYIGNRDRQSTGITPSTCTCCMIDGCYFENLDSGIYGYNAGGGLQEGLICNNCYFTRCKAGINLDYWVEYSKFTNCITFQCYYGCINNGGNNTFTACTFHGVIGFLIDNSSGSKSNVAHGTVNGCTFNHIDNMNNPSELGEGIGIKVLNVPNGFIFTNCQLWYGRVHIESSTGIQITGCEFGGLGGASYPAIETSGNSMVFVDNCLFQTTPTLAMSSPSKITNCWTYNGVAVTA